MAIEIPGYKILRTLGKGGMATVYLAEQEIFERQVALKVMSRSLAEDPAFGQRFMREAKIVSQLVHPNIVNVHDVGMHDAQYYLSMQYIDGHDLKVVRSALTLEQKIHAVRDIAKALDYAGAKGYIHRDIKPENILFDSSDGRAILTDFGIAKAAESDLAMTQTGTAIGTPHYMSPEQAKGLGVDKRADIYSLGVVFFLLLTGSLPYDAQSAVAIGIKHITEPVPLLPNELNSLQYIIDKMMAKRVSERYQTASEVVAALDTIDLDVLNHTIQMAVQVGSTSTLYNTSAETELATSQGLAVAAAQQEGGLSFPSSDVERQEEPQSDFTVVYHTEDEKTKKQGFIWFSGICLLVAFFGWLGYQQFPQQANGLLSQAQQYSEPWLVKARALISQWDGSALNIKDTTINSDTNSVKPAEPQLAQAAIAPPVVTPKAESVASNAAPFIENAPQQTLLTADDIEPLSEEVLEMQKKVAFLEEKFAQDASVLPSLLEAYRALLKVQPDNGDALLSLQTQQQDSIDRVLNYKNEGKYKAAKKALASLEALFPTMPKQELQRLSAQINTSEKIADLLTQADAYLKKDQLIKPSKKSALYLYKRVLALDENNSQAKLNLTNVALKLANKAENSLNKNEIDRAHTLASHALEADANLEAAQSVMRRVNTKKNQLKQLSDLLRKGAVAENNMHLYHPRAGSAYAYYSEVLAINSRNKTAQQGLVDIYAKFENRINEKIANGQLVQAKNDIVMAQKAASQSELLPALSKKMLAKINKKIAQNTPKVDLIAVTSQPIINLSSNGADIVAVDKKMYVAFTYENFQSDTSVVQATLLNSQETLEYAKQPVVLSTKEGQAQFVFDSGVEAFKNGKYVIYLRSNGRELIRYVFEIKTE